jgi:hypothetical protein
MTFCFSNGIGASKLRVPRQPALLVLHRGLRLPLQFLELRLQVSL